MVLLLCHTVLVSGAGNPNPATGSGEVPRWGQTPAGDGSSSSPLLWGTPICEAFKSCLFFKARRRAKSSSKFSGHAFGDDTHRSALDLCMLGTSSHLSVISYLHGALLVIPWGENFTFFARVSSWGSGVMPHTPIISFRYLTKNLSLVD